MSNRERWVVYPMLLFTFLMATRDDYVKPERFDCDAINCRRLVVTDLGGKAIVSLGASEDDAGAIRVYGARDPIRLPDEEVANGNRRRPGHEIFEVGANDDGGYLRIFGARPGFDLQLGHDGVHGYSGLTAINEQDDYVAAVELPAEQVVWGAVLQWPAPGEAAAAEEGKEEDEAAEEEADEGEPKEEDQRAGEGEATEGI